LSELIREKFKDRKVFIAYFMGGYPSIEKSYQTAKVLIENGVDMLEIGVPFSDPVADGVTIQVAHEKAVKDGITPLDILNLAERIKGEYKDIPLILMTYYNPIYVYGEEKFLKLAKDKGVDGLIIPDLPPEEAGEIKRLANSLGLSIIFLIAPTTYRERIKMIGELTDSFIYYVSLTGITGAREELPWQELEKKVKEIKKITGKPVAVGFGVSKGEHTARLGKIADGVIVGSAIVKLQGKADFKGLEKLIRELKEGLISID